MKVTANTGFGSAWLAPRLAEFRELYPDIELVVILTDEELDLSMREADVALRLREPTQPDFIRRRLFTVHYSAYASRSYLDRFGRPQSAADLDAHRIVSFGVNGAGYLKTLNLLLTLGRDAKNPRTPAVSINNILAMVNVIEKGAGVGVLPDYVITEEFAAFAARTRRGNADVRLLARLPGGNEKCRARDGLSRFSRRQRSALARSLNG